MRRRFFKRDRERREVALERSSSTWLNAQARRIKKAALEAEGALSLEGMRRKLLNSGGAGDASRASREAVHSTQKNDPAPGSVSLRRADPYSGDDIPPAPDGLSWHYASVHLDPTEGLVYTCTNCRGMASRMLVEGEESDFWRDVPGGHAVHACKRDAQTALVPRRRSAMGHVLRLTPIERGSLEPKPCEYVEAVLPAYVTDAETLERELELRAARAELEEAIERRNEETPGPAPCTGLALSGMGHRWRKVPGQPLWFCLGCGLEASTAGYDLVRGHLSEINTRDTYLIQTAGRLVQSGISLPTDLEDVGPLILEAAEDLAPAKHHETVFEENPGDPEVCLHCGCIKSIHVGEKRVTARHADLPLVLTRLFCPIENQDVS